MYLILQNDDDVYTARLCSSDRLPGGFRAVFGISLDGRHTYRLDPQHQFNRHGAIAVLRRVMHTIAQIEHVDSRTVDHHSIHVFVEGETGAPLQRLGGQWVTFDSVPENWVHVDHPTFGEVWIDPQELASTSHKRIETQ